MTRVGRLRFGRMATWMDGTGSDYAAATTDPLRFGSSFFDVIFDKAKRCGGTCGSLSSSHGEQSFFSRPATSSFDFHHQQRHVIMLFRSGGECIGSQENSVQNLYGRSRRLRGYLADGSMPTTGPPSSRRMSAPEACFKRTGALCPALT